ncbi:hypothetical protein QJS10_CPB17g00719 [Acorus calamus]|uniref:Uncharacterized protein n=1 Tax=Acorus calamus TaxID=4465 RepID=A0AAV9CWH8_ACOCL|nr:hypothetical protein QJS10_CPB17g00719 [Acorus calamus]
MVEDHTPTMAEWRSDRLNTLMKIRRLTSSDRVNDLEKIKRFILGEVTCKFSKEEVALITGLPFHRKALDLHSKKKGCSTEAYSTPPIKGGGGPEGLCSDLYNSDVCYLSATQQGRVRQRDARAGVNPGYIAGCTAALMVDPELKIG